MGSVTRGRPAVAFIAWTPVGDRSVEIARALGGEALVVYYASLSRRFLVPLRYALSTIRTTLYLASRRPKSVIATNPPLVPGLLCLAYARLVGGRVVLDSHPGSFGVQGDRVSARLQAVNEWLVGRVDLCLVTSTHWVDHVRCLGGEGLVFHEGPPLFPATDSRPILGRPRVLFVGTFAGDEPIAEVLGAARECPEMDFRITGSLSRAPAGLERRRPRNVTFTGFLPRDSYRAELEAADLVLALTTEPTSVMRAAYEAVAARRPLVVSDWPGLRELFPFAVPVANTVEGVVVGLREAVECHDELCRDAGSAEALQAERTRGQLRELSDRL